MRTPENVREDDVRSLTNRQIFKRKEIVDNPPSEKKVGMQLVSKHFYIEHIFRLQFNLGLIA